MVRKYKDSTHSGVFPHPLGISHYPKRYDQLTGDVKITSLQGHLHDEKNHLLSHYLFNGGARGDGRVHGDGGVRDGDVRDDVHGGDHGDDHDDHDDGDDALLQWQLHQEHAEE
ncbi:hypothetical protein TNCV_715271 [Trichonephila clavipes]|nr:hypothetical protein TNCV_715271 [Trichonephila clavipes]